MTTTWACTSAWWRPTLTAMGPNKTAEYVSQNPVQATRDDNTLPEFASTSVTREITENSKGDIGSPITATDGDNDILTYSLVADDGNNDNDTFNIDRATGQLKVKVGETLNFEGSY